MNRFQISSYKKFSDLPLEEFNHCKFSVYVIDFDWNYLFVNNFVQSNLGERGVALVGKNMWTTFPQLKHDPVFTRLKDNMDKRIETNLITTSPLTFQRLNIVGYPLEDCFFFSATIFPEKSALMNELREELLKVKAR